MSFQYSLRSWTHSSAWIRSCLGCCWALLSLHRKSKQTWNAPRSTRSLLIFSRPLNQSRSNRRTHQSQCEKWKIYDPPESVALTQHMATLPVVGECMFFVNVSAIWNGRVHERFTERTNHNPSSERKREDSNKKTYFAKLILWQVHGSTFQQKKYFLLIFRKASNRNWNIFLRFKFRNYQALIWRDLWAITPPIPGWWNSLHRPAILQLLVKLNWWFG